jgi:hypothetical protein
VNTDHAAAVGARPSDFFVGNKFSNSQPLDVFKVLDHTHVVSGPISFIHVLHLLAWKTVTFKTELYIPLLKDFAVFDFAPEGADGFIGIFHPATWAGVLVSQISHASAAVHSTGGDERDLGHPVSFKLGAQFARTLFKICWTKNVSPLDGTFF